MGRRKKTMAHHADNQVVEPQVTSRWYRSVSDRIYMAFIYVMLVLAMPISSMMVTVGATVGRSM